MGKARSFVTAFAVLATLVVFAGSASAQPDDERKSRAARAAYTTTEVAESSILPPEQENVRVVGRAAVHNAQPNVVSDVAYLKGDRGRFAYLGEWAAGRPAPDCTGGVYVFDVTNPTNPREVNFIPSPRNTYVTEGLQALRVDTRFFTGDLLLVSNEACGPDKSGFEGLGGLSLYDITNPLRPQKLSVGVGDTTIGDFRDPNATRDPAHEAHSIFGWQAGEKLFAMTVDNEELLDLDFWNITDPTNPRLISETGLTEWPDVEVDAHGTQPTDHDFQVKQIDGHFYAMISYWDAGWVLLNVDDPKSPQFIDDYNYPECDPVPPGACPPEGNAHQGEWSRNGERFVGTEEIQSPFRLTFHITEGPHAGEFDAGEFGWTVPIDSLPDRSMNGPTVFGDYGCPDERDNIPTAAEVLADIGPLAPGEDLILVLQRGPVSDPNHDQHGACFFSEKVETAQLLGYDAAIVANHHSGAAGGAQPDSFLCGSQGHQFTPTIPGTCVGHRAMHLMFDTGTPDQTYPPDYTFPYPAGDPGDVEPDVGDLGFEVAGTAEFSGWGYARLLDADTLQELDQLAVEEQSDPACAQGCGDLSVHEVAMERSFRQQNLAYFSWYDYGFVVGKFGRGDFRLVGEFREDDSDGSDFWGVELAGNFNGKRLVAGSDRDFGLYLFTYTGP